MAAGWPAEVTHRQCVISPEPNIPHFNVVDNHIFYHYSLWPLQLPPRLPPIPATSPGLINTNTEQSQIQITTLWTHGRSRDELSSLFLLVLRFPPPSLFYGPGCLKLRQNRIQRGSLFNGYGWKHTLWCPSIRFYLYSPILQIKTICRLPLHTDCITNKRHKIAHKFWFNFRFWLKIRFNFY